MVKLVLVLACALSGAAGCKADEPAAKPAAQPDHTDGDGTISEAERAAPRNRRAAEMEARFDADGDGKLTPAELKASGYVDPLADTDHDGNVSQAELAAALYTQRRRR